VVDAGLRGAKQKGQGMWRLTLGLAAAAAIAAPAGQAAAKGTDLDSSATMMSATELPKPDAVAEAVDQEQQYEIGPFDVLDIAVFQVDTLSKTLQVDGAGHIEFPMIGEITAAGKTPKQLGEELAAKLDQTYLRSPQVTVYVKDSASQKFTVEGAVKTAGVFPLKGRMTLLRAIATAQGVDQDAKLRNVVIFRTVDQKRIAGVVNLGEVRTGKVGDPQVYAGDVIVVPSSSSRKAFRDLIAATPLLLFLHP
jgi:polysaccharide export outer membrane protein